MFLALLCYSVFGGWQCSRAAFICRTWIVYDQFRGGICNSDHSHEPQFSYYRVAITTEIIQFIVAVAFLAGA